MFNRECQVRLKPFIIAAILLIFATTLTSCIFGGKERYVSRGEDYLKKRRFQEAVLEFRSAAQVDRNYAPAHWGLARAYEGSGYSSETMEELRRVIELDPVHLEARAKLGTYLLSSDPPAIEDTHHLLDNIFNVDPNYIDGHILKAALLSAEKKSDQEIEDTLNYAISLDANRIDTYLSAARYYYKAQKNEKAEQTLNTALTVDSSSAPAYIEYGKYYDANGRTQEAEIKYQKAVEVESGNLAARETLAQFYFNQNQYDKAEQTYKELVEVQGNVPEAKAALAGFYVAIDREDDAVRIYEEILADAPEFAFARYQLAEIYLGRNDVEKLNAQLKELLSRDDKDMQALMLRARMNVQEGNVDEAITDLEEVLRRSPIYREALFYIADAKIRIGQVEQARTYVSDIERYYPKYMPSRLLKIQAAFGADEPKTALTEANGLIEALKNPALNGDTSGQEIERLNVAAITSRGLANMQMRNFAAAQEDLGYVRQLSPSSPGAHINLGRLAVAMRNNAEAGNFYEKALTLEPENFDALAGLTNVWNGQKQFNNSLERIEKAIGSAKPRMQSPLMYLKAQTYVAQGNSDGAEAEFLKAIQADENYLPAYSAYASLLVDKQQTDRALEQYQKMLQLRPNDASTYTLIALLEDGRSNAEAAETNYRKALDLNPGMPIAANNLAWIIVESQNGNPDEALQFARNAIDKVPNNPAFYDTLGWVYHKKGLQGPAIENLKKAVAMEAVQSAARSRGANPAYNLRLGIALAAQGDKQNARREVETALRNVSYLNSDDARNAKSLLESL